MRPVTGVEQIFPAVDELIAELRAAGAPRLATVFHHRMHRVAWATRSELFEELQEVLTGALNSKEEPLPGALKNQVERVLLVIRKALSAAPE